jgi:hypothetical protein
MYRTIALNLKKLRLWKMAIVINNKPANSLQIEQVVHILLQVMEGVEGPEGEVHPGMGNVHIVIKNMQTYLLLNTMFASSTLKQTTRYVAIYVRKILAQN